MIWQNMFAYVANEFVDVTSTGSGDALPMHLTIKNIGKVYKMTSKIYRKV